MDIKVKLKSQSQLTISFVFKIQWKIQVNSCNIRSYSLFIYIHIECVERVSSISKRIFLSLSLAVYDTYTVNSKQQNTGHTAYVYLSMH